MNKPFRLILIVFVLELVVVASLGLVFQKQLEKVENKIEVGEITTLDQVQDNYIKLKNEFLRFIL